MVDSLSKNLSETALTGTFLSTQTTVQYSSNKAVVPLNSFVLFAHLEVYIMLSDVAIGEC